MSLAKGLLFPYGKCLVYDELISYAVLRGPGIL